jgi:nucleoside-diphosphate-sugar epimerase
MKILITGINGWVASALAIHCRSLDLQVRGSARLQTGADVVSVGEINANTDWTQALRGCDAVIHLASRVHVMHETVLNPLAAFREVNTAGTLCLARQATAYGIRRFVFVSSIKVNGESTPMGRPFRPDDPPAPQDAYAISKCEAESDLRGIAATSGMEVVIVRPPLVYGPGVKGNFATMIRAVSRGIPLPLASITHNRRSLVAIDNLVDFLALCARHPAAANQTFLISDGMDLSTATLLHKLAKAMNRPARLMPFPTTALAWCARIAGQGALIDRLLGNLQVDQSKNLAILGWTPPAKMDDVLLRTMFSQAAPLP